MTWVSLRSHVPLSDYDGLFRSEGTVSRLFPLLRKPPPLLLLDRVHNSINDKHRE